MSLIPVPMTSPSPETPLIELRARQCRFITSDDLRDAMCCGAPTPENSSWCEFHRQLVYVPRPDRMRRAA